MTSAVASIHTGFKQLGISDEDEQRDLYERVTGVRRLTLMKPAQKDAVVDELRRLGFSPARSTGRKPSQTLSGKYASAVRAFWLSGYNLGVFRNPDDRAILEFAKGQTGLEHIRFAISDAHGRAIIEAIKAIVRRETGADALWRPVSGLTRNHCANDGQVQVLYAQWLLLQKMGEAPNIPLHKCGDYPEAGSAISLLDRPALIALQQRLGRLIRAARQKAKLDAAHPAPNAEGRLL